MFSKLKERVKYLFFEIENDWEMGIASATIKSYLTAKTLPSIKWLSMPRTVFWADPFGVRRDDKYYIFYEEYPKEKGYATINCMALDLNFNELERKVIIDEGYHFSFPFLIQHKGVDYMLPETCAVNKLILYRSVRFPFEWKQEKVLLNIPCIDSVLFFKDEYWWLVYSKSQGDDSNAFYYVRKNADLFGDWEKSAELSMPRSLYNSRSGGSVIEINNELYRVTQNCTDSYGQSVVINKIISLSDTAYNEEAVNEISDHSPGVCGFHTISAFADVTLVDRRRERLFLKSPGKVIQAFLNKLK